MQLVDALAAGVRGAENGHAELYLRGTSTRATWYSSFEGDGANSTGANVTLDSYGGATVYVASLVDVYVKNSLGTLVRKVVAGARDDTVEVVSPAFTGSDYVTGISAVNKPTTLAAVLDAVLTSFGTTNWNVLFGGSSITLQQAVAGNIYVNVKGADFGAKGDGVTDDTAAINAAILSAFNAGGLTVFFPPGTYLVSSAITVKANVSLLGFGSKNASTTIITRATSSFTLLNFENASECSLSGLEFLDAATGTNQDMMTAPSGVVLLMERCRISGTFVGGTKAAIISNTIGDLTMRDCVVTVCSPGGTICSLATIARMSNVDVTLVDDSSSAFTNSIIRGRVYIMGCSFISVVANTLAPANGIVRCSNLSVVVGSTFTTSLSLPDTLVAIGTDGAENEVVESGNMMQDPFTTLSVGGTGLMRSLSREMRRRTQTNATAGTTTNINPDFGINVVVTTGAVGTYTMAFSTTNRSKSGIMHLIIRNTSANNHTIDFSGTSPVDTGVAVNAGLVLRATYLFTTAGATTTWFRMTGFTVTAI